MRIRVDEIKCRVDHTPEEFRQAVRDTLNKSTQALDVPAKDFDTVHVLKKSLDARKKPDLRMVYSVEVSWDEPEEIHLPNSLFRIRGFCGTLESQKWMIGEKIKEKRPVVAGCGPAGLFAALTLAMHGCQPVVVERGKTVGARIRDITEFWGKGALQSESNVQFGEGGAGTFSDGKLTTRINNPSCRAVLETFVDAGAPEEILYLAKPHIGTDLLRDIIGRIRKKIEYFGGTVLFETRLTGIKIRNNAITGVEITTKDEVLAIETDTVILAIGHSARDTIRMLCDSGVEMQAKPFSMGVRIEHFQKAVNESQYGNQRREIEKLLPAADYKLSCHLPSGRDVYTFCMCPGGQVIAGASGEQQVVTNGMSLFARAGENANSAVLVNVKPSDFASDSPLAGMDFQEKWEHQAFLAGGASYKAPAQYVGDFLKKDCGGIKASTASTHSTPDCKVSPTKPLPPDCKVSPTYQPGVAWTHLSACLPDFVTESIRQSLPLFERKLAGFASPGAVMTGIESRSSSPVRILRDSRSRMASIEGLYPCGEGAGFAGGIMSAAVDGIASAESYIERKKSKEGV